MRAAIAAGFFAAFFFAALFVPGPSPAAACPESEIASSLSLCAAYGYETSDSEEDGEENADDETVPQPDTTIVVRPGTSLEIENFGGSISVKTWDKDALKIAAEHSLRDRVIIERVGSAIRLKVKSRRWVPATIDYRILAPRWMKLELSGVNTDIDVQDSHGEIRAETVQGDITLKSSSGFASLSSVQGAISAVDVRGRVEASSVNDKIRLANVIGPIFAESVNGGIEIEGAQSDSVEASTVNGPVSYEGVVSDAGYYHFATHNGCIDVAMPEQSNATVSLSTFSGGIDSSFPVTMKKIRSQRFQTTLGSGRARIELESFQGTIFLRRPSEARATCDDDEDKDGADKTVKYKIEKSTEKHEKIHKSEKSHKDDSGDDE